MSDRIRVLHVDDDPGFADLTAKFLRREDDRFEVVSRPRASQALDYLGENGGAVDCIVSDHALPGTDGLGFLEAVREEYPDLPFIFFTGRGSEEVASDAIAGGATDYLQKQSGTEQYELLANRVRNAVEQARARREQETVHERMNLALGVTDTIAFEIDLETRRETRHGPFERLFGVAPAEVATTADFYDLCVHPGDRDRVERTQTEGIAGGADTIALEFRTHPDRGEVRWLYSEAYVVTGPDGEPERLIGLDTDITDRVRRERQLERYESMIERLPVGVFLSTLDGEFVRVNEAFVSLLGADSKAEIRATAARDFYADPDVRDDLVETLEREGTVTDRGVELRTLDGEEIRVSTTLTLAEIDGERYTAGVSHEVTDRQDGE